MNISVAGTGYVGLSIATLLAQLINRLICAPRWMPTPVIGMPISW